MEAAPRPPRVLSQETVDSPKVRLPPAVGRRDDAAGGERSFLGTTFLDIPLDEIVEERALKGGSVTIGTRGGEWYYSLHPIELSLPENARMAVETMMGKLPERVNFDTPGLLKDQKLTRELVRTVVLQLAPRTIGMDRSEAAELVSRYSVGFGPLELLLSDQLVEDVLVSSPSSSNPVCVVTRLAGGGSGSAFCRTNLTISEEQLERTVTKAMIFHGGELSALKPILELEIPHLKARLSAAGHPASPHGLSLTFRRRSEHLWTLPRLMAEDSISWTGAGFLSLCCSARASIVIAGGRGSGKTTLLASLLPELPSAGRTLVMEDTQELPVTQLQREGLSVQALSLAGGIERASSVMRAALRMGEGAIVVGEIRGEEARILFESMRTGTAGSSVLGTLHASDSHAVRDRIVLDMGLEERSFHAIDLIAMTRQRSDPASGTARRCVYEISLIEGEGGGSAIVPIFKTDEEGGCGTFPERLSEAKGLGERLASHMGIEPAHILTASRIRGFMKQVQSAEWRRTGDDRALSVRATRLVNGTPVDYRSAPDPAELKAAVLERMEGVLCGRR
jgi:flagellar protein FlaI